MSDPSELKAIATQTLRHYQRNADGFWDGTRHHDVTQNYEALLGALRGSGPRLRILDFGCGPGRDLAAFHAMGHEAIGLDGCAAFVEMARHHSGCDVWLQSFFELALPAARFDGVFANASLFHVPRLLLRDVLQELNRTLAPGGVLFCSNPRSFGADHEGWHGDRYGCYLTAESWAQQIASAGFSIEQQFLRPPGKPAAEQPWAAVVARKQDAHSRE